MHNLRSLTVLTITALLLVYGAIFYQLKPHLFNGYSDFVSFYTAGKIVDGGNGRRLYDLALQHEIQQEVAPNVRTAALPFVRPAFEAWLFRSFAHFPYRAAFVLWDLVSCACLLAAVTLLRREVPELRQFSLFLMFMAALSYFPVFVALLQGQDTILLLLIYTIAYIALRRGAQFLGGVVLGLGVFKFPLLLPFLVPFCVRRRWLQIVMGFFLTSLLVLMASIATVGWSASAYYPRYLLSIDRLVPGVNIPQGMPNIRGLLSLWLQSRLSSTTGMLLLVLLSILLLTFVINKGSAIGTDSGSRFSLWFSLNIVVTLLVSYHCHSFDLCLLVLPISLVLGVILSKERFTPRVHKALVWALICVVFSPVYLLVCFGFNYPSLLGIILVGFAIAIGLAVSDPGKERLQESFGSAQTA